MCVYHTTEISLQFKHPGVYASSHTTCHIMAGGCVCEGRRRQNTTCPGHNFHVGCLASHLSRCHPLLLRVMIHARQTHKVLFFTPEKKRALQKTNSSFCLKLDWRLPITRPCHVAKQRQTRLLSSCTSDHIPGRLASGRIRGCWSCKCECTCTC